jgi:hypothetical protein
MIEIDTTTEVEDTMTDTRIRIAAMITGMEDTRIRIEASNLLVVGIDVGPMNTMMGTAIRVDRMNILRMIAELVIVIMTNRKTMIDIMDVEGP